ncbi:MAG: hypothetical protein QM536_09550 [Chitinophagaceae bacterium]|nr:hypothetical protein [Chitinophagaceae bacterium]
MKRKIQRLPFVIIEDKKNNVWSIYYREICLEVFNNRNDAIFYAENNKISGNRGN